MCTCTSLVLPPSLSVQMCFPVPGMPVLPQLGAVMALAGSSWRCSQSSNGLLQPHAAGDSSVPHRNPLAPQVPGHRLLRCTVTWQQAGAFGQGFLTWRPPQQPLSGAAFRLGGGGCTWATWERFCRLSGPAQLRAPRSCFFTNIINGDSVEINRVL